MVVGGSGHYWLDGVEEDVAAAGAAADLVVADGAAVVIQAAVDSADLEAVAAVVAEPPGVGERPLDNWRSKGVTRACSRRIRN